MKPKKITLTLLLTIFCLTGLFIPAAQAEWPDFGDNCASAKDMNVNTNIAGWISRGDNDYFEIVVPAAGTLTLYTTDRGGGNQVRDTRGDLYNDGDCSWSDRIASNDDANQGSNEHFRIEQAVSAGTYWLRVRGGNNNHRGKYRLYVDFVSLPANTITASAGTGGTISPSGAVGAPDGSNLTFTITENTCYEIADVLVDGSSVGATDSYTFTNITGDHDIEAVFTNTSTFTINVISDGNGVITPGEGALTVACGTDETIGITALPTHKILNVIVDGESVVDPLTVGPMTDYTFFNVMEDHTLEVRFTDVNNYIIITNAGENGSIVPAGPIGVPKNTNITFSMAGDPGFEVDEVWVDGTSYGQIDTYTIPNVVANHELRAEFKILAGRPNLDTCIDISDVPLDTRVRAAPANIMFVLDDSGSMDWEFMTEEGDGLFDSERYIFDNPGDNVYSNDYILDDNQRKKWKSQWSEYNMLYYNPLTEYTPWPTKGDADTTEPWSHPHVTSSGSAKLDLTAEFTSISANGETVIVDDSDDEFSIESGDWDDGGFDNAAYNSDFTESKIDNLDKIARWSPNLVAGNYDVFVRWAPNAAYAKFVEYHVVPDGTPPGPVIIVDQSVEGGTFGDKTTPTQHYLGNFTFTDTGYVELRNWPPQSGFAAACADAVKFVPTDNVTASIKNAHYYTWHDADEDDVLDSGETVYLVNFVSGDRQWYIFNDDGDDTVEAGELTEISESSVPEAVNPIPSAADDLQNFANWYSFYRRRELSATGAIATVLTNVQGLQIGLSSINGHIKEPVRKIHVDGVDETATLLSTLYSLSISQQGTPLRQGLQDVGEYYHKDDDENGGLGSSADPDDDSPIAAANDGGECQQCFAIVMTDGFWNGSSPGVGNTDEDDVNSPYDGAPYADTYDNTLADVAMEYYENDLAPNLSNFVPTNTRDTAEHQHMVTYTIGFGVSGSLTLAPDYLDTGVYPTWTDPDDGTDAHKIDDLMHAAINGRGRYMSAQNSLELINELYIILKDIAFYSGSASSVSVNGDELYTKVNDDVLLFQSKYYSETWHGDVLAYQVDGTTGALVQPALWSAAKAMSLQSLASRKIATYDGTSGGIPFQFDSLTSTQKDMLDATWTTDATHARNIVNYVRGDASLELDYGGTFRNRAWQISDPDHPYDGSLITSSRLGDIVHASPVFHNGVLYSGGNDGMLHAFDAATGQEFFGYVPNHVMGNLPNLTDPTFSHKFYVDLTPSVTEVDLDGGSITTMLVGGLGKGGRGYYALDLTNVAPTGVVFPVDETDLASIVMWEFPNWSTSNATVADLGYSYSKAEVVKSYDPNYPYIMIFGNGYASANGRAVLFILNPETGEEIMRIDTGASTCNGMSTPVAVDVNYDDKVDYVYAGDLKGNLWKFDLTSDDAANWEVAFYDGGTPMPLFKAAGQPITTRPDVMYHCEKDGYMVLFGTGKYLEDWDLSDTSSQAVYGIWDYGDDADDEEYVGTMASGTFIPSPELSAGTPSLLAQSVENVQIAHSLNLRTLSANQPDWTRATVNPMDSTDCGDHGGDEHEVCDLNDIGESPDPFPDPIANVGWYFNLPDSGERVVGDVIARDGSLIVVTYTPGGSMCATGGNTWVMSMNACSGGRLADSNFDINGDGAIDDQDLVDIDPDPTDEFFAPPTGIQYTGRLQPPAILILNKDKETLYMSSSMGTIQTLGQKAAKLGVYYWNIFSQ